LSYSGKSLIDVNTADVLVSCYDSFDLNSFSANREENNRIYVAKFIAVLDSRNTKLRALQQRKAMCNHGFARQLNALRQLAFIAKRMYSRLALH
jgi:hypothetical protein